MRRLIATMLTVCMVISGLTFMPASKADAATPTNVANGRNNTTYTTSNANTGAEGFCYVNSGFSAINMCNETLTNGNNLLGKTATTDEVAVWVDLGANYDISSAVLYQGSTNPSYPDSYCKNYSVYYSTETVNTTNKGDITWNLAGTCTNGTIYSGAQVNSATDVSSNGDTITFNQTHTARSVKFVFDKNSCMGTGNTAGTVSILSLRVYGVTAGQSTDPTQGPVDDGSIDGGDGVVDVLFIGNSFMYYNTSWNMFKGIANYHGHNVKVTAATNGGQYLTYQATAGNVLDAIAKGPYDIVVLQDKVGGGFNGTELAQGCNDIIPKIRQYSPNAKLAFYEPWPTKPNIQNQINDFTKGYINIAKTWNASLAPAGEGFYELYTKDNLDYYCSDNRHPQPLGTFNSASTIYYALFPQDAYKSYTESDHNYLDTLINNCVAYTNEGQQSSYNLSILNKINGYAYKYAHAVIPAVKGTGTYTTVKDGGVVANPTDGQTDPNVPTQQTTTKNTTTAPATQAQTQQGGDETLYGSFTTDLAQGKKGYASSNDRNQSTPTPTAVNNLTDGNVTSFIVTHKDDTAPWFAVDLGSVQDINRVNVLPGGDGNYSSSYPINYEIQVASETTGVDSAASIAGLTWRTVKTVTGGTLAGQATTFARQSARWVRIKVNSSSATTCSLEELYVYQTDPSKAYNENETTKNNTTTNNNNATTNGNTGDSQDVLFIGNSMTYYNNLYKVVKGLAEKKGHNINTEAATNGGQNIIYQSTATNVLNAIKKGGFEVVVLQDIVGGFNADNLQIGADEIIPIIKQYNPEAQIIFYEPWPTKDTILGANSLLPYFTQSYIKTAKSAGARLAPAGEAFYELYTQENLDFYCADNKHPQPLGTFTSASTIYYTLYPDEAYGAFSSADQSYYDSLINTNVAYTNEGQQNSYSIDTLNKINAAGYKYAHAVAGPVAGNGKYTSVAGAYDDPDDTYNPSGLPTVTGTTVDASAFTAANGNIAIGKTSTASSGNATLGNNGATGDRWESTHGVDPQWFVIDFGKATAFDTVGFIWEGAYASKYYIQVSDNGSDWETVQPVAARAAQTVQIDLGKTYNKRYVRMMGASRGTTYGYSFYEMGVWNKSGETVTDATTEKQTDATTVERTTENQTDATTAQATTQAPTEDIPGGVNKNEEEVRTHILSDANIAKGKTATASSTTTPNGYRPGEAIDGNFGSVWGAATSGKDEWLAINLGKKTNIGSVAIAWEGAYASKYVIQVSDNGEDYTTVKSITATKAETLEVTMPEGTVGQYVRIYATEAGTGWEMKIYEVGVFQGTGDVDTTTAVEKPEKPSGVTGGNGLIVSWDTVGDATSYNIYVDGELVVSTTALECDLTQYIATAGTHKVEIRAVNNAGVESEPATINLVKENDTTAEQTTQNTETTTVEETTQKTETTTVEETTQKTETTTVEQTTQKTETTTVEETTQKTETTTVEQTTQKTETTTVEETTQKTETTTVEETTQKTETTQAPTQDTTKAVVTQATTKSSVEKPAKVKVKKAFKKKSAKKLTIKIKKNSKVVGYQVMVFKTKKNAKKAKKAILKKFVKNKAKIVIKSSKLKNKKNLFVRVRAYVLDGDTKVMGDLSKVQRVKVK